MSNSRVLVIDDEADIRELLDMTLSRMGLEAHCAGTVSEALSLLARNSYDLCLTDMRLPDGDGLELVRHIANLSRDVPVAVITATGRFGRCFDTWATTSSPSPSGSRMSVRHRS